MRETQGRRVNSNAKHQMQLAVASPKPPAPVKSSPSSIIEFSSEVREDPNEGLTFGDAPANCGCPHCGRSITTFIDYEASWVSWVLSFVVWFSLGWMAFWLLPLLWPAFKDVVHHCPRCLNVVARRSRISLPTFRSEVMTFKVGSCAMVLARKYVVILAGLIATIFVVYLLRSQLPLHGQELSKGHLSTLSWEDFLNDCGMRPSSSFRRRSSANGAFEDKYRRRTFHWQGEVRQVREGLDVLFFQTKSLVLLNMRPPRYARLDLADIVLIFDDERYKEVSILNIGDWVDFEATMLAHGHRGDPEVMALWHIAPIKKAIGADGEDDSGALHGVDNRSDARTASPLDIDAYLDSLDERAKEDQGHAVEDAVDAVMGNPDEHMEDSFDGRIDNAVPFDQLHNDTSGNEDDDV